MISVGIPGSPGTAGSVITDGSWGSGSAAGDELVLVSGGIVSASVVDGAGISVLVGVFCCNVRVGGTTGGALEGGTGGVVRVMVGSCGGAPRESCMMPQTISAIRMAISAPHPAKAIGVRQPGIGSSGSHSSHHTVESVTP